MRAANSHLHMILAGLWNFVILMVALVIALGIAITGPPTRTEIAAFEAGMHRVIRHLDIAALHLKEQMCKRLPREPFSVELCRRPGPRAGKEHRKWRQ